MRVLVALLSLVCTPLTAYPALALGDSLTGDRGDGQVIWPLQVHEVEVTVQAHGGWTWAQVLTLWAPPEVSTGPHGAEIYAAGVNDIIDHDDDGHTVFATEKAWLEERAATGRAIYWFNLSPFKRAWSVPAALAGRLAFNADFAAYCVAPVAHLKCVDVSTALQDPNDTENLLPAYDVGDGIHLSTAGHAVKAAAFEAVYP